MIFTIIIKFTFDVFYINIKSIIDVIKFKIFIHPFSSIKTNKNV